MPRFPLHRTSRLAILLSAAVLSLAIAAGAAADTPPGRGPDRRPAPAPTPTAPAGDCAVLLVQLHGNLPATDTCLTPAPAPGTGAPGSGAAAYPVSDCLATDLRLYQDTNYGGKRICFRSIGMADLRSYLIYGWPLYLSWDDRVSSFITGDSYVNFYEGGLQSGSRLRYASYQSRASMPSGWNDRVTSLCVLGPGVACP
jgi:hypothetical protein